MPSCCCAKARAVARLLSRSLWAYSETARRMMEKFGWTWGAGLGVGMRGDPAQNEDFGGVARRLLDQQPVPISLLLPAPILLLPPSWLS